MWSSSLIPFPCPANVATPRHATQQINIHFNLNVMWCDACLMPAPASSLYASLICSSFILLILLSRNLFSAFSVFATHYFIITSSIWFYFFCCGSIIEHIVLALGDAVLFCSVYCKVKVWNYNKLQLLIKSHQSAYCNVLNHEHSTRLDLTWLAPSSHWRIAFKALLHYNLFCCCRVFILVEQLRAKCHVCKISSEWRKVNTLNHSSDVYKIPSVVVNHQRKELTHIILCYLWLAVQSQNVEFMLCGCFRALGICNHFD